MPPKKERSRFSYSTYQRSVDPAQGKCTLLALSGDAAKLAILHPVSACQKSSPTFQGDHRHLHASLIRRCKLRSRYERDRKLLEFFEKKEIRPGTRLKVRARNYDGTLSLAVEMKSVEIGGLAADRIWIAKVP